MLLPGNSYSDLVTRKNVLSKFTIDQIELLFFIIQRIHKVDEMAINLAIDDNLLTSAQNLSGFKTKEETVNQALKEFVQRRKQTEIISLFGILEYEKTYKYKAVRYRRHNFIVQNVNTVDNLYKHVKLSV